MRYLCPECLAPDPFLTARRRPFSALERDEFVRCQVCRAPTKKENLITVASGRRFSGEFLEVDEVERVLSERAKNIQSWLAMQSNWRADRFLVHLEAKLAEDGELEALEELKEMLDMMADVGGEVLADTAEMLFELQEALKEARLRAEKGSL